MGELKTKVLEWVKSNKLILILSLVFLLLYLFNLDKFPTIQNDENWFANPAYMLVVNGKLGTTLMYGLYNMQNFTYWQPPLYLLLLAVSFKLLGLGVVQGRIVSVFLGFMSMIFTYLLAKEYYNENVGIIAAALLTFNFLFLYASRTMRMEIAVVCFTLISVFVVTLALERSKMSYFFISGIFAMLASLSHPNGIITILIIFIVIFVYKYSYSNNILQSIRSFLKEKGIYIYSSALILTSIPYIIYISLNFSSFKEQFMFNIGTSVSSPINNILLEPTRYITDFYTWLSANVSTSPLGFDFIFLIIVFISLFGIIFAYKNKIFGDKVILSIFLSQIILFAVIVSHKSFLYVSIILPFWSILIARIFYKNNAIKNLLNRKYWKSSSALFIIILILILNIMAIMSVFTSNYNYYMLNSEINNYIPTNSSIMGEPTNYLALTKNYNYYSSPINLPEFRKYEYESIKNLQPNYILFDHNYEINNLTIESQKYVNENYKEIGVIPKNDNIWGSPLFIYMKDT